MKIDVYEVPVTLKRLPSGEVEVTLHEDTRKWVKEEGLPSQDINMIPNLAKQLADHNDAQRAMVKNTMLKSEQESTAKIYLKYLS